MSFAEIIFLQSVQIPAVSYTNNTLSTTKPQVSWPTYHFRLFAAQTKPSSVKRKPTDKDGRYARHNYISTQQISFVESYYYPSLTNMPHDDSNIHLKDGKGMIFISATKATRLLVAGVSFGS